MANQNDITGIPAPQPEDYDRQVSFTDKQIQNPNPRDFPQGADLDAEFNAVERALDQTQARLRLVQRDDGALQNGIVTRDALASEVLAGVNSPTTWEPFTQYAQTDSVIVYSQPGRNDPAWYVCEVAHISSDTFTDDLAAGNWRLLVDLNTLLVDAGATQVSSATGTQTLTDAFDQRTIPVDTVADLKALPGAKPKLRVSTKEYHADTGAGGNDYVIEALDGSADDGGSVIHLKDGVHQARGVFTGGVWIEQFGADPLGIDTSHEQAQSPANYSAPLNAGVGRFRMENEILLHLPGASLIGQGGGIISNDRTELIGARTVFFVDENTSLPRYRKTRRLAPETASDPDDSPLSVVINNQSEGACFENIAIVAECDYNDNSPENLGGDVDVGFFNGCRTGVRLQGVTTHGYFRVASEYWDVTASTSLPPHVSPGGITYPPNHSAGSDQIIISKSRTAGGRKGCFVAGAKWGTGTYYDYISEDAYPAWGGRGGSGASDMEWADNCYYESRDHHSGQRAYDPTMDPATENIDAIAGCIAIDGRRGSTVQGRIRRFLLNHVRMKSGEAGRLVLGDAAEVDVVRAHTEPNTNIDKNTSGDTIDVTNYALHSYGPIMCKPTGVSGDAAVRDGVIELHVLKLVGTGLIAAWSTDQLKNSINSEASEYLPGQSQRFTIAPGSVVSLPVRSRFGAAALIAGNISSLSAVITLRAASSPYIVSIHAGASINTLTGVLTGGTGPDGTVNISAGGDNNLYIENRTAINRLISVTILGSLT